jgi:adenine-specific DNA methylase
MTDTPRLIEVAFPLKQASLDSVHEKNVRHGHISTLHIWPARRPLAACRAALIATLLPDPGAGPKPDEMTDDEWQKEIAKRRRALCEKIGGKVVQKVEKKKMPNGQTVERIKEETEGGILHWKREKENAEDLQWFRDEIRKAYGGRAPKVLDPFAGGGAIPLEAMRLGCEATAIDINPVAWFILKCTLEYPQKLAGQKRSLPEFILRNRDFMEDFLKAQGIRGAALRKQLEKLGFSGTAGKPASGKEQKSLGGLHFEGDSLEADLAWHVRAWGQWVLDRARSDLARFYPTYADFEPLKPDGPEYQPRAMQLVPLREDGTGNIDSLNAEFTPDYLETPRNPRWVAKPTVAYLWARTVTCKNCRAMIPLLKTLWLCKKDRKRVLLTMEPNNQRSGVVFGVQGGIPMQGGNAAQRREHDKRISQGTMSRAGARCPCCTTIVTTEDIRLEGQAGRVSVVPTAVVVDGQSGQEYRLPTELETNLAEQGDERLHTVYDQLPFGIPGEPIPQGASRVGGGSPFTVYTYGFTNWGQLFRPRQLVALGTILRHSRDARDAMKGAGYPNGWVEAVCAGLSIGLDKLADRSSAFCRWDSGYTKVSNTFARFALPILWDFCEANPLSDTTGNYGSCVSWVVEVIQHAMIAACPLGDARAICTSVIKGPPDCEYDLCLTDPPYYDAIPYSDLMDFFYVWLRRSLHGLTPEIDHVFSGELSPKWDHEQSDGELIDDASRYGGDNRKSKAAYEEGMARAFSKCHHILRATGRLVVVFAHKNPDAWESLVSAIIRAGFVVDGSWPVQTEMGNRTRALSSAALASSVWIVCKKRPETARPGWDNKVLDEMRANIALRLRDFWDAGIRGPDFVWAATGPAMEAYSKHPVVKKANEPGQVMSVTEFLHHVRRIVVDFVVGRVLFGDGGGEDTLADRLDDVTAYYLLHRHDFGLADAPVGGCILYAVSCGLSDSELADTWDILSRTGGSADEDEEAEEADPDDAAEAEEGSGSKVKLKTWAQRNRKNMGYEAPGGRPVPLIDRLHRLIHLWRAGDATKVDEYLDNYGLRRHELFRRLLQSLIELSAAGSDERATLESISNHIGAKGAKPRETRPLPGMGATVESEDQ